MTAHWAQGWISFVKDGKTVVLCGEGSKFYTHALVELHMLHDSSPAPATPMLPEVQHLLEQFSSVFSAPTGLPPRRQCDHHIPLIPGAQPVSIRPYRVSPQLKTELERQVSELL